MSWDYQIRDYLKETKSFIGVFSSDTMPYKPKKNSSMIVNYSPSDISGTHWIGMRNLNTANVEFFDSYGFDADAEDIILSVHTSSRST